MALTCHQLNVVIAWNAFLMTSLLLASVVPALVSAYIVTTDQDHSS